MISSMFGNRARASSAMTPMSPLNIGRLKSRSRTFRLRRWALSVWNSSVQHNTTHRLQTHFRWALSVWNSSVQHNTQASDTLQVGPLCVEQLCTTQHNTQASDTLQVGPLRVEQLCTTQHAGFRHTSGGPSLWNSSALSVWNSSAQHNMLASDTVDTLQG